MCSFFLGRQMKYNVGTASNHPSSIWTLKLAICITDTGSDSGDGGEV